jgi:NTE family protein
MIDYFSILDEVPLFAGLTPRQRGILKNNSAFVEYKKGQLIYKEGSDPGSFYCILRGRVAVSTQDRYGRQTVLEHLHRGRYFGVISCLTGEPHSVSAKVITDALILEIKKADFEIVLRKIPQLAIELSKSLSRRLKRKDVHQKTVFESTIIAVISSRPQTGKTVYASNLAFSLGREAHKRVIIIDICPPNKIHRLPLVLTDRKNYKVFNLSSRLQSISQIREFIGKDKFGVDLLYMTYSSRNDFWQKSVIEILSHLVNDYHYIVLDLPCYEEEDLVTVLSQADLVHVLTKPRRSDLRVSAELIKTLTDQGRFPASKIRVVVNQGSPARGIGEEEMRLLGREVYATLPRIAVRASGRTVLEHPEDQYSKIIRRIARQEGDCLVGLALGVGAAYGFCHIGVLKVIERERIPIDAIVGASIGAVIASLWATGRSSAEILGIAKEFRQPQYIFHLLDFTFPVQGFIKGNRLYSLLKKYLGSKTFYDVKVPLKIVASDVKRRETHILDRGSLVDAIMASCAMPGIFTPFKIKDKLLFDGGVINPLPTEPLIEMGVKRIIAVNVTPSKDDIRRQYEAAPKLIDQQTRNGIKEWFNIRRFFADKLKTNVLDFIFTSFEIMQSEVVQKEAKLADVVLHPDLSGLHWLSFHKADEFAKRGEEETRENLDKIKQLIS